MTKKAKPLVLLTDLAIEGKRAILELLEALSMIETWSAQRLPVLHALALNLAGSGYPEMARRVLEANPRLYSRRRAGKRNVLQLIWLEGRIALALGELGSAEAKLNTARLAFEHRGSGGDAALSALDLALVYARQERRDETVWLVEDLVRMLRTRGIAQEAIAGLLLLKRACQDRRPADILLAHIETIAVTVAELLRSRLSARYGLKAGNGWLDSRDSSTLKLPAKAKQGQLILQSRAGALQEPGQELDEGFEVQKRH